MSSPTHRRRLFPRVSSLLLSPRRKSIFHGLRQPTTPRSPDTRYTATARRSARPSPLSTDTAATCKYGLVAGTPYSSLPISFTTTGSTTHSTLVSALTDGSSYTYYVRCSSQGFPTTGDYIISFSVTPPAPAPSAPPAPVSGGTPPPPP